ncbi:MAG: TRAP transporter large permease subunit, partial [Rhodoplanes sp.]
MESAEPLAILMVVAVVALLMIGYPVALTLAGVSLIFAALGDFAGVMHFTLLGALPQRIFGVMTNEVLLAIPLFVFMGVMLERSRIAEELLETMGRLFGSLTGGLAISATLVGTLLAAAKGVAGATTVTMGLITLPAMMRHGYDPRLAAGTVAATATLAQIMPPATVLVLLADQVNIAFQSAQLGAGKFSPDSVSIGDLFAGAIIPALLLVSLYLLFQIAVAILRPKACPAVPPDAGAGSGGVAPARSAGCAHPVDRSGARLDPRGPRHPDRSGGGRRFRRDPADRIQDGALLVGAPRDRRDHPYSRSARLRRFTHRARGRRLRPARACHRPPRCCS